MNQAGTYQPESIWPVGFPHFVESRVSVDEHHKPDRSRHEQSDPAPHHQPLVGNLALPNVDVGGPTE
ncbi:Uncharacterised protein [Vibrio cholerae]|nr:Uncharacterised protein [Vibrio cholerae]CSC16088.1 Uncharacterised protein [Vibrio cholerae]CSC19225.1 Uncharacterised protein [Vibrio cholerae]CSC88506.1 Uncharacterised protein [Vibrio cholerae]